MGKKFQKLVILFLIFIFGFLLRFVDLGQYPHFSSQEALLGWRAKSLLQVGKDETGRRLPLIFSSLEGYELPFSSYLTIPSVGILGLNKTAVRFPFAFVGTAAILALFGITRFLFPKDEKMAFWSAFFLAVNPWTVYLSRNCSAVNLSFSLFLLGFYFLLLGSKQKKFLLLSFIFLLSSLWTSRTAWFFVPLFLIAVWFFLLKEKKVILWIILLTFLGFLPLVFVYSKSPQVLIDLGQHDFSLLGNPLVTANISLLRGDNIQAGSRGLGRIFYNKSYYLTLLAENYLKHFNPRFYFAAGDSQISHGLTQFGPILLIFLPFTLLGIGKMFKKEKRLFPFLVIWFFIGIIPSSLSFLSPDQEKTVFVLPVLALLTAVFLKNLKTRYLFLFWFLFGYNFLFVFYDALANEPHRFQEKKQFVYLDLAFFLSKNASDYQNIYITDAYGVDPAPAIMFYLDWSPGNFLKNQPGKLVYRHWINEIGHIMIDQKNRWEPSPQSLFILTPEEKVNLEGKNLISFKLDEINSLEGEKIFEIWSFKEGP